MGNNTQLLNTLNESDLYRLTKANGLADYNRLTWGGVYSQYTPFTGTNPIGGLVTKVGSAGNILRLTPGVDITLPDRELVPGTQGEKIVFQVSVDAKDLHVVGTCTSPVTNKYTLFVVFQYGGIFTMVPGSGALDMIPIKSATEALAAPIVRVPATPSAAFTQDVNGAGIFDGIKKLGTNAYNWLKKNKVISSLGNTLGSVGVPFASAVGNVANRVGMGVQAGGC